MASSKSRALAGSIVKVRQIRQVAPGPLSSDRCAIARPPPRPPVEAARVAPVGQQRLHHVARDVRAAQRTEDLRPPPAAAAVGERPYQHEIADAQPRSGRARRRTSCGRVSKNGSTTVNRPRRSTTPTRGSAGALRAGISRCAAAGLARRGSSAPAEAPRRCGYPACPPHGRRDGSPCCQILAAGGVK